MSTIDWSALKQSADDATKPAPDGEYTLKCRKAEAKTASTGSQMIACQFAIEGGPSHGKTVFNNFVLTPDNAFALSMFFKNLAAFGIDPAANNLTMEQIASMLEGQLVDVTLSHRTWQGVDRNEVKEWRPNPMSTRPTVGASPAASVSTGSNNLPPTPAVSSAPPTPSPAAAPVTGPAVPAGPPPDEPF